ncbi:hypothetical protein LTR85_004708 [Meristemomyces frigidus]|nr:hypothetical protein LTR85_004708 [Meristemomyces frigidus]
MDIFAKQHAAAQKRHASPPPPPPPPPPSTLSAPPPVHDPERPSALAGRRQRSPPANVVTGQAGGSSSNAPASRLEDADVEEEGDSADRPIDLDAPDLPETPTSGKLIQELEKQAPQLVEGFQAYANKQNALAESWHAEYLALKKREDERIRSTWKPLEENPEVLEGNEEAVAAREAAGRYGPDVDRYMGGLPPPMPDSSSDVEDGGGPAAAAIPAWQRFAQMGLERERERTREAEGDEGRDARSPRTKGKSKSPPSSSEGGGVPIPSTKLAIEVKLLLLPALILLSTPQSARDIDVVRKADGAARKAYDLVRLSPEYRTPLAQALNGRCCFYRGVFRMARSQIDGKERNALTWFRRAAVDAKGLFVEAEWAEKWIEACVGPVSESSTSSAGIPPSSPGGEGAVAASPAKVETETVDRRRSSEGHGSPLAEARPWTAGSWVSDQWRKVTQAVKGDAADAKARPPPLQILHTLTRNPLLAGVASPDAVETESPISPKNTTGAAVRRPEKGERISAFSTEKTGSTEYDHHGVTWSQSRPFGNGEILPGRPMQIVESPDRMAGFEHDDRDSESDIPYKAHGGHVPIGKLRTPNGSFSDQGALGGLRVVNGSTGSGSLPGSSWAAQSPHEEQPEEPKKPMYRIVNGSPSTSSGSDAQSGAVLPVYEPSHLPTPGHSPTYQPPQQTASSPTSPARHSPRRSVAFLTDRLPSFTGKKSGEEGPQQQQQPSPASASGVGLYARRKLSQIAVGGLQAITTAREADPLAEAEEGQSPFRSRFGGDGSLLRKRSGGSGSEGPRSPDEMV